MKVDQHKHKVQHPQRLGLQQRELKGEDTAEVDALFCQATVQERIITSINGVW